MSRTAIDSKLYGTDLPGDVVRRRFLNGEVRVGVYGLGKMGLPLAAVFADVCGNVVGADVDESVVGTVNSGECHVKREPGLRDLVSEAVADDALRASTDPRAVAAETDIHVVIVPTPITEDKEPNLSILDSVVADIGSGLDPGDLVLIECTVPPRTCVDRIVPMLEEESGLTFGEFGLAFCPERTSSGRALEDIRGAYPKIVGGVDESSARVAKVVYDEVNANDVITVSDATTAEAVKVFEGLYRDVNIALANELGTFADELGISVNEAIDGANTQPFCEIHSPGPGVGGHCIPWYPYFMIEPFETEATLLQTARSVNDSMPSFTVSKLREEFEAEGGSLEGSSVLVLGLTYRPGVEEIRATPALPITRELSEAGAAVFAVDPMLDDFGAFPVEQLALSEIYDRSFDAVVLVTPHAEFETIRWGELERDGGQLVVVDGRRTLDLSETDHRVYTIGGP